MLRKIAFLLFLFLTANNHLFCQYTLNRDTSISVLENGIALKRPHSAVRKGDYKLIKFQDDKSILLFNF